MACELLHHLNGQFDPVQARHREPCSEGSVLRRNAWSTRTWPGIQAVRMALNLFWDEGHCDLSGYSKDSFPMSNFSTFLQTLFTVISTPGLASKQ